MRIPGRVLSRGGSGGCELISAKITAGWIRKGASVCGRHARADAVGTLIVGRGTRNEYGRHPWRGPWICNGRGHVENHHACAAIPRKQEISVCRGFQAIGTRKRVQVVGAGGDRKSTRL